MQNRLAHFDHLKKADLGKDAKVETKHRQFVHHFVIK